MGTFRREANDIEILGINFDARRRDRPQYLKDLLIDHYEARREPAARGDQEHALKRALWRLRAECCAQEEWQCEQGRPPRHALNQRPPADRITVRPFHGS